MIKETFREVNVYRVCFLLVYLKPISPLDDVLGMDGPAASVVTKNDVS